jgi:hypothetical protein
LVQNFYKFILRNLISYACSLLKLTILLAKSIIESWDFDLIIIHE